MPYFMIKEKGRNDCVCVCQAKTIEDIDTNDILGSVKIWEVQEIHITEARHLLPKLVLRAEGREISEKELDILLGSLVRYVAMRLSDTPF